MEYNSSNTLMTGDTAAVNDLIETIPATDASCPNRPILTKRSVAVPKLGKKG
jgi:hypothetical protein